MRERGGPSRAPQVAKRRTPVEIGVAPAATLRTGNGVQPRRDSARGAGAVRELDIGFSAPWLLRAHRARLTTTTPARPSLLWDSLAGV